MYSKVIVETPQRDTKGKIIRNSKGQPVADTGKRDTENVPLKETIEDYMKREVYPFNADAWYDQNKVKVGYEIPFTKIFYKFQPLEPSEHIASRIEVYERSLVEKLRDLFEQGKEE